MPEKTLLMPPKTNMIPDWIAKELPPFLKSRFFKSKLGNIHYLTGGEGQPVLFVHGNPVWSFLWRKVIQNLDTSTHQVYAPDLMNLGFSDSLPNNNFNMGSHAQPLIEFVEGLNLTNLTLVVQDWGGPLGLYMASSLPHRIKGLVILNTGISAPQPPFKTSKFHEFVNKKIIPDILFNIFRFPMYGLHKVQADRSSIQGVVAKAYRYPLRVNSRWGSALQFARMVPNSFDHPSFPLFQKIEKYCRDFKGPVQVVWGIKDPILGRQLKRVKAVLENAHYQEVEAGHFLQEECPEEIAAAIERVTKFGQPLD